jgi:hypothetical protein
VKKVTKSEKSQQKQPQHYAQIAKHLCVFFLVKQPPATGITLVMPGSYLKEKEKH